MLKIRHEKQEDYTIVENVIRQAFYNVYMPGCYEHYLTHVMRHHEDFIPELDFVMELDGQIIGNIMYTKAKLVDENNHEKDILYSLLLLQHVAVHFLYRRLGSISTRRRNFVVHLHQCGKLQVCLGENIYFHGNYRSGKKR